MAEVMRNEDHLETVAMTAEALEVSLRSGEATTALIEQFSDMERSVFVAGQNSALGITEGLGTLAGYAGRGHQASIQQGFGDGEIFFVSKLETYRNMMEAMASKPSTEPKSTDTTTRRMSGRKDRI